MGKAQKLKEQRKLEREQKQVKKKNRKKLIVRIVLGFFLLLIVFSVIFFGKTYIKNNWFNKDKATKSEQTKEKEVKNTEKKYDKAPEMTIDKNKKYIAKFETSKGNFSADLDAKNVPVAVNNFVFLSKDKFYDDLSFHRIVKDFMIQGGDPKGDGTGGPGYKFDDEKVVGDYSPGVLAMANSGANTNGSQFFIMTGDYSNGKLPKNYVIFGKVISGMDVVKKIAETPTTANGSGEQSKPNEKVIINKVTIEEK
ncbi:MAG: peptidylprolyl isomerase [bacterium]